MYLRYYCTDDRNSTPETDVPSAYTQFESDGENDEGGDEVSSVAGDDEADMQLPLIPEMHFKFSMISGLGRNDNIASGEVSDSFF
ncbi:hypothetical protein GN244_ATG10770 [Phytophthora infestans]|uniref:Uncharacterized protein n=1 Tax=Phytophthora infestans TaxID=4787 RepID=A0A833SQB4_PHYIN|nr:hypothetical protein GN244_ATG10770 [Phytophthora infestans]